MIITRVFSRRLLTVIVTLVALLVGTTAVSASSRDVSKLWSTADGTPAGGKSTLVRDGEAGSVSAHIAATHLERGHAYTYWWVVFNDPSQCLNGACDEDDIFNDPSDHSAGLNISQIEKVGIGVLGGNGEVANRGGRAAFTGTLYEGSSEPNDVLIGPGGLIDAGSLLEPGKAVTAEIHILIRDHGPALSGAALAAQLNTFGGNCAGFDPAGTYACFEPQFAVHKP